MVVFCSVFKGTSCCYFSLVKFIGWLTKCQWWLSSSSKIDIPLLEVYSKWTGNHRGRQSILGHGEQVGQAGMQAREETRGKARYTVTFLGLGSWHEGGRETLCSAEGCPQTSATPDTLRLSGSLFSCFSLAAQGCFISWQCLACHIRYFSFSSPADLPFLILSTTLV